MIIMEFTKIGTKEFKKTYSDEDYVIHKIGTEEYYDVAYDILESEYQYEETDRKIEKPSEEDVL